jgi:putative membrane protein
MMYWWNGSAWGFLMMTGSMVLFWGLVVGAIVLIIRAATSSPRQQALTTDPRRILAERFARGEIDETEYRARLAALGGGLQGG